LRHERLTLCLGTVGMLLSLGQAKVVGQESEVGKNAGAVWEVDAVWGGWLGEGDRGMGAVWR